MVDPSEEPAAPVLRPREQVAEEGTRISCDCGAPILLPPDYKAYSIQCRRCGQNVIRPVAPLSRVSCTVGHTPSTPAPAAAAVRLRRPSPAGLVPRRHRCLGHPDQTAVYRCESCARFLCGQCVKVSRFDSVDVVICECHGRCVDISLETSQEHGQQRRTRIREAYAHPLRGTGRIVLLFAALYPLLVGLTLKILPPLKPGAMLFDFLGLAMLCALLLHVVNLTITFPERDLEWPEVESLGSILGPAFLLFCVSGLSLLPAFLLRDVSWMLSVPAGLLGVLHLPGAILSLNLDGLRGLAPWCSIRWCRLHPGDYVTVAGLMLATFALALGLRAAFSWVPLLGHSMIAATLTYACAVMGRLLGLLYLLHQKTLDAI